MVCQPIILIMNFSKIILKSIDNLFKICYNSTIKAI